MVKIQDHEFPDHLLYDIDNQIWYEQLGDGTLRTGFTPWAVSLMGDVLVFTPKRLGHTFDKDRWFAMVEGGKWVGAARAAFEGTTVAHNEALVGNPGLLNSDPFGQGWMTIVKPAKDDGCAGLVTGVDIGPAMAQWIAGESYKNRAG